MTDKNPRGKKPVFSDTAPCIMLTFCSHKFSDLQLWTTTGCVRCQPEVCSRLTLFQDRNIIWLIRLLFCCCFFFFFLLPCSKLDVFVQKDVLKQFFFFKHFAAMETGASWATVTTILKGCGTVQGTVAVYGQLKLWSYCYNHPQGMWDSSGYISSL